MYNKGVGGRGVSKIYVGEEREEGIIHAHMHSLKEGAYPPSRAHDCAIGLEFLSMLSHVSHYRIECRLDVVVRLSRCLQEFTPQLLCQLLSFLQRDLLLCCG